MSQRALSRRGADLQQVSSPEIAGTDVAEVSAPEIVGADVERTGAAEKGDVAVATPTNSRPARPDRAAPSRPPVASPNTAPVVTKKPAPFAVRMSEFLWICSLMVGALALVYYFVIRKDQTPLIADAVRAIQGDRPDAVYDTAADIVYWIVFWIAASTLVIQIALLVSFMNRRSHVRLWQFGTVVIQAVTFLLAADVVAVGERGELLRQLLLGQVSLSVLALLFASMTRALKWTSRKVDIRRISDGGAQM